MISLSNYFVSGWIENLGVVPLFLLAAFLLEPDFLSFILLLHFVTCVLDAIFKSSLKLKSKGIFVTPQYWDVKVFLALAVSITYLHTPCFAQEVDIFLAKGEQSSLKINNLSKFSVGNPEVISAKYDPVQSDLLIKAKTIGYSDIILWKKGGKKLRYHIYSRSKRPHALKVEYIARARKLNLKIHESVKQMSFSGLIENEDQYHFIQEVSKKKNIKVRVKLSKKFRNTTVGKIYKYFLKHGATYIDCSTISYQFICNYRGQINKKVLKYITNLFHLSAFKVKSYKNIKIEYKIVQVISSNYKESKFGFDKVSVQLDGLINKAGYDLNNFFRLNEKNFNAKVIASPTIKTQVDERTHLELGSEIPFQSQNQNGSATQWKFAGLKVKQVLSYENKNYLLNYKATLSWPTDEVILGSKAKGKIRVTKNKFTKAFEITYKNNEKLQNEIPLIGKIPILRFLFSSSTKSNALKHIIGYIRVSESNE